MRPVVPAQQVGPDEAMRLRASAALLAAAAAGAAAVDLAALDDRALSSSSGGPGLSFQQADAPHESALVERYCHVATAAKSVQHMADLRTTALSRAATAAETRTEGGTRGPTTAVAATERNQISPPEDDSRRAGAPTVRSAAHATDLTPRDGPRCRGAVAARNHFIAATAVIAAAVVTPILRVAQRLR